MKFLTKAKWLLWLFAKFKVPMIGYTGVKLISIDHDQVIAKIKLKRRTKNHVHSMYIGAMVVGADVAGGLHAVYHAYHMKHKLAPLFKSLKAEFHKRAEDDVYFVCKQGQLIHDMILQAKKEGQRINQPITIEAYTHFYSQPVHVASFVLELSVKVKT